MYKTKAMSAPISSSSPIIREPKKMVRPMAPAVRMSTGGSRPADSRLALIVVPRRKLLLTSKSSKLRSWRFMAWTTRTPVMFSFSAPLTIDAARRAFRYRLLASGCQMAMMTASKGTTAIVISASFTLMISKKTTMPTRLSISPSVITIRVPNSWSWPTSPWTRDMRRPTSVRS